MEGPDARAAAPPTRRHGGRRRDRRDRDGNGGLGYDPSEGLKRHGGSGCEAAARARSGGAGDGARRAPCETHGGRGEQGISPQPANQPTTRAGGRVGPGAAVGP